MPKPLIKIHNVETNEVIEREMTNAEFAQYEIEQAEAVTIKAAKLEAEAKRQALLDKLGITEEEAKLLLGQHKTLK